MKFEKAKRDLPPLIGRSEVATYLPGIVASKTLSNLKVQGKGPRLLKIGGRVVYMTEDFLDWLEKRSVLISTSEQRWPADGED